MSRTFDARQHALKAHRNNKEEAVQLFLDYLNISREDFEYEENCSPETYIFGNEE